MAVTGWFCSDTGWLILDRYWSFNGLENSISAHSAKIFLAMVFGWAEGTLLRIRRSALHQSGPKIAFPQPPFAGFCSYSIVLYPSGCGLTT